MKWGSEQFAMILTITKTQYAETRSNGTDFLDTLSYMMWGSYLDFALSNVVAKTFTWVTRTLIRLFRSRDLRRLRKEAATAFSPSTTTGDARPCDNRERKSTEGYACAVSSITDDASPRYECPLSLKIQQTTPTEKTQPGSAPEATQSDYQDMRGGVTKRKSLVIYEQPNPPTLPRSTKADRADCSKSNPVYANVKVTLESNMEGGASGKGSDVAAWEYVKNLRLRWSNIYDWNFATQSAIPA